MRTFKNKFGEWEYKTHYIVDANEISKVALPSGKLYGLDIETAKLEDYKEHPSAGLCPHLSKIRLLQIYDGEANVYVFDLFHIPIVKLSHILKSNRFVAHNGLFEIKHLTYAGYRPLNIGCSMIMSQLVHNAEVSPFEEVDEDDEDQSGLSKYKRASHSLDAVIQRLFGVRVAKQEQMSDWSVKELSVSQITYAGLDALLTYKAAKELEKKVIEYKMAKSYKLTKDVQHPIAEAELTGIPVNWEYHAGLIKEWEVKSNNALAVCKPYFGDVNMRSGKQMSEWLVTYFNGNYTLLDKWPKTEKGSYAFGRKVLADYTHLAPIAALLEYKKWDKLLNTYGTSLLEKKHPITGRLHTSYTLGMTTTGRLSSRNPNIQNAPRDKWFRDMFSTCNEYEVLVVSDFSSIELRLQAQFSKDPAMNKWYREKQDAYKNMASSLFNVPVDKVNKDQRFVGKTVMLALGYGMGSKKLGLYARNSGIIHKPMFWDHAHLTYHNTVAVYSSWCDRMRERAKKLGYAETLFGKRRKLAEDEMYTSAVNTIIQGSAAELMMKALIICQQRCAGLAKIVATVHDEILLITSKANADKVSELLAESMCDAMRELFPDAASHEVAEAAYAMSWGDAKAEL